MNEPKRLSVSTVAMLLVAVIFGIGNVTDNLAALGLSAIPSWLAVGVSVAYVRARRAGLKAPFQMVRSTSLAVAIGVMTFALSALGYVGAGLNALDAEVIDWIYVATVYLGPGLLILLGLVLRWASLRRAAAVA